MLRDRFGRPVTSLRISVTQRCNLNCIYCHGEGEEEKIDVEMTPEEIEKIVKIASFFGVRKIKLTGGEPLVREDICEIVSKISQVSGIEEVSMTTNGVLLEDLAEKLKKSGLSRVNVNLVSINPETYRMVTGGDVTRVLRGLEKSHESGLTPIKLNMVVLRSINDHEIWDMVDFASENEYILQLIELENLGNAKNFYDKHYLNLEEIEKRLKEKAEEIKVRNLHNRVVYSLNGGKVKVELVRPFHNSNFCM
ncbi:GTP 3',8-cyclase MoaA, partial [Candidatus Bathyarchaeota archaeon]